METSLTERQRQILDLLRAGKVNKEIANELGIGLGTVKQHVVALFKKLKVKNRAAAISRGFGLHADDKSNTAAHFAGDGLLERRPCIVLSVALPEAAGAAAGRLLHQTLAAFAFDHDALFLARKGHAGDLILGIQRAGECDLFLALRAAHVVFRALAAQGDGTAAALRGGLTAATAIASMHRRGGWSGEAIAATAIAQAREFAHEAAPGALALAPSARELMRALSPCAPAPPPAALAFGELDRLPWREGPEEPPPLGRDAELARLDALLIEAAQGEHRLAYLEGETGMGKSRLCRHVAAHCRRRGGNALHFICQPDAGGPRVFSLPDGAPTTLDAVFAGLAASAATAMAVIVDDAHLLPAADLIRLTHEGRRPRGRFVLLAARRLPDGVAAADAVLRLGRLTPAAIEWLAVRTLDSADEKPLAQAIGRSATGVPLFAIELARHHGARTLPLALRFIVGARMDGLGLDLPLLRRVARTAAAIDEAELVAELPPDIHTAILQAVASGVLKRDERNRLSFRHPLLRQAVIEAQVI